MVVFMIVIMTIAILSTLPQFGKNSKLGISLFGIGVLSILMSLFPIQARDFLHVGITFQTGQNIDHFEDVFIDLWECTNNYVLWRLIVFGLSTILMICTIKLLKINGRFAAFIFVITEMFMFGNLRNMLGIMMMFFSVVLIMTSNRYNMTTFRRVIGALGLLLTIDLHKSMWLYELLLLGAIIPFGKKTIRMSMLIFPILWGSVFVIAQFFIAYMDEDAQFYAEFYTNGERATTLYKIITETIRQVCYIYLFYIIYKHQFKYPLVKLDPTQAFLARYAFILIYLGYLFIGQATGGWLYERFVGIGEVALMFLIMYFFYYYPRTRGVKMAFGGLLFYLIYNIAYTAVFAENSIRMVNYFQL